MNYRYIRVIIDLMAGSKAAEEKQELMKLTLECCKSYAQKHAEETEVEVRVNEVDGGNVMRVLPVPRAGGEWSSWYNGLFEEAGPSSTEPRSGQNGSVGIRRVQEKTEK